MSATHRNFYSPQQREALGLAFEALGFGNPAGVQGYKPLPGDCRNLGGKGPGKTADPGGLSAESRNICWLLWRIMPGQDPGAGAENPGRADPAGNSGSLPNLKKFRLRPGRRPPVVEKEAVGVIEDLALPVQYVRSVWAAAGPAAGAPGNSHGPGLAAAFSRDWQDRSRLVRIGEVKNQETATVAGSVKLRTIFRIRRGLTVVKIVLDDGTGLLAGTWFNQPYMRERFKDGERVLFYGKAEFYRGWQMANPDYEHLDESADEQHPHGTDRAPLPGHGAAFPARAPRSFVFRAGAAARQPCPISCPGFRGALAQVSGTGSELFARFIFRHPGNPWTAARARLIFEELFLQQVAVTRLKHRYHEEPGKALQVNGPKLSAFTASLPFALTQAQVQARDQIFSDLSQNRPMHRLLQGDVGSGKTIVAILALLTAVDSGLQAALMAPTEVLAAQHFFTLKNYLAPLGVRVELFTSGIPVARRRLLLEELAQGAIQVAVGTHALTQEKTVFRDLGLAVVDEQHRFGVEQRALLRAKGLRPHVLVMTATPIPRTLALTVYGDLDVTTLHELPPGRMPVHDPVAGSGAGAQGL